MTDPSLARYAKQARYAPLGEGGQRRLGAARVLVCGCGALGSAIANTLARAGVGHLTVVDRDYLEESNLQRQVLYTEADVAARLPKAVAAAERLRAINSTIEITPVVADVTADTLAGLAAGQDLLMDGTDNFEARLLLNDYAVREGVPWVYGGVVGAEGRAMPIVPGETACFACLMPEPPAVGEADTCDTVGVLGPAVAAVAAVQCVEALKLLAGPREAVAEGLTVLDLWSGAWRRIAVPRDPACPCCAQRRFRWLEERQGARAAVLCGRGAVQLSPPAGAPPIDLPALRAKLAPLGEVTANAYLLRLKLPEHEVTVFADGRAIVAGVEDEAAARAVWARVAGV